MFITVIISTLLQTTQPADPALDWLMGAAAPTTRPAAEADASTRPTSSPFVQPAKDSGRVGTITLSDGTLLTGEIRTTDSKALKIWDEGAGKQRDVTLDKLRSAKVEIVWQRDEPEWRFKTSGSDEKVYTGKTYPARETRYVLTLTTGETFTGTLAAPLYVATPDGERRVILHKRDKGDTGQSLKDLVYPISVVFDK
jgi:hypothetical protein